MKCIHPSRVINRKPKCDDDDDDADDDDDGDDADGVMIPMCRPCIAGDTPIDQQKQNHRLRTNSSISHLINTDLTLGHQTAQPYLC